MRIWGVFVLLGLGLSGSARAENVWSRFSTPAPGNPESIGSYAKGCLRGAIDLPSDGIGYQTIYSSANHHFGHSDLIRFVSEFAKNIDTLGSAILVGELSQIRGGPFDSGHDSHQIGLDADILFHTHPEQRVRSLSVAERDQFKPPSMLDSKGEIDLSRFGEEQVLKLKYAALDPKVERIFVNPAIKLHLCTSLKPQELFWLRKIRPWRGHHAHFHVRIHCPLDSRECIPQSPVPGGTGCPELIHLSKRNLRRDPIPFRHGPMTQAPLPWLSPDLIEDPSDEHFEEDLNFPVPSSVHPALPASCMKVMED